MIAMKAQDGWLYIVDVDNVQGAVLKSWRELLRWNKTERRWEGRICLELLDRLSGFLKPIHKQLPAGIEAERQKMRAIQDAVDAERVRPDSEVRPLVEPPVKAKLFTHQIRALNMCLLTFELVDP